MPTLDLDSDNRILKKIILEVLSIMAYHSERCHSAFLDALLLYKVGLCQRSMCWIRVCCQRFSINNWSWDEREVCAYIPLSLEGHFYMFVFAESSSLSQCFMQNIDHLNAETEGIMQSVIFLLSLLYSKHCRRWSRLANSLLYWLTSCRMATPPVTTKQLWWLPLSASLALPRMCGWGWSWETSSSVSTYVESEIVIFVWVEARASSHCWHSQSSGM